MINKGLMSSNSNEWATPQDFFDKLNMKYNFTLDPCATKENAKCKKYYTMEDDGLKQSWEGEVVFCNPPYGRQIKEWVKKAYETKQADKNTTIVMLIPARTDTRYWHDYIFGKATDIQFIKGRLKFGDSKNSAPFPSALIIY